MYLLNYSKSNPSESTQLKQMWALKRICSRPVSRLLLSGLVGYSIYSFPLKYHFNDTPESSLPDFSDSNQMMQNEEQIIFEQQKGQKQLQTDELHQQPSLKEQGGQVLQSDQQPVQKQSNSTQYLSVKQLLNRKIQEMKPMEAIITSELPQYLQKYLKNCNFTVTLIPANVQTLDSQDIIIKNNRNDTIKINMKQQFSVDKQYLLSNLMNPPRRVDSMDTLQEILSNLKEDENLIFSLIPSQDERQAPPTNQYNTYLSKKYKDPVQLENGFANLKYSSTSNRDAYIMINKSVAKIFNIGDQSIGKVYMLNSVSKYLLSNFSNVNNNSKRYIIKQQKVQLLKQAENSKNKKRYQYLSTNSLGGATLHSKAFYEFSTESELDNLIRQIQMTYHLSKQKTPKLLVVHTQPNENKPQFTKNVEQILSKTKKIMKQRVVICKIKNPKLLESLRIIKDQFATIRLFNLGSYQKPAIGETEQVSGFYSRSRMHGPFQVQNLCYFIDSNNQQYYQTKKNLPKVYQISSGQLENLNHTLVLFQKSGCPGCHYTQSQLQRLKQIINRLSTRNEEETKYLIYKYHIEQSSSIKNLDIKRYNILNEHENFVPPQITPQLYYFNDGKHCNLKIEEVLSGIKQVEASSPEQNEKKYQEVSDKILREVLYRVTECPNRQV